MELLYYRDREAEKMTDGGAHGVTKRVLFGKKKGAENFIMRVITFEPNSASPSHSHPWEHEAFVINGRGTAIIEGKEHAIRSGDAFFLAPNEKHCFKTTEQMEILCLIPTNEAGEE